MQNTVLPVGSLVVVSDDGPFRGLKGTIQMVNTIEHEEAEEPFCFYLVALERSLIQEPIWFEHDEVEAVEVASPSADLQGKV